MATLLYLAFFENKTDRRPDQRTWSWDKVVAHLSEHAEREEKDGPLFSPTLYKKGAARGLAGVQRISLLVLDFDRGVAPEQITPAWEPYEYLLYSTFSHTNERPKWRAVFPLQEAVIGSEWPRVYRNLAAALGQGYPDPACKDASRIYYLPSCQPGAPRFTLYHPGAWLGVNDFPHVASPAEEEAPAIAETTTPIQYQGGRVAGDTLVGRALERCATEGRNNAGLWFACQLRDNGFDRAEAERWLQQYQERVPDTGEPYTWEEALHSLEQAWSAAPRTPWEVSRPFSLGGGAPASPEAIATQLEAAKAAVAALKKDPGAIYTPEALAALAGVRRWDAPEWARLRAEIRKHASLKDLERALGGIAEQRTPMNGEKARYAGEMLEDCPTPLLRVPTPYVLKEHATGRIVETENGSDVATLALGPILISGRARDTLSGQELLLLAWRRPAGSWQSRIVDRGQALVSRRLAELADHGFPYLEERAKDLATYLSRLEAANYDTVPCARVSSHLGWQGKPEEDAPFLCGTTLVLPDGEVQTASTLEAERPETWSAERVMFHGAGDGEQQIVSAFCRAGTWDGWMKAVELIREFPRMMVTFYAAFCPPLLAILNVPNFIVDLSHATTTGKTTALRAAGSVWGNPDDRAPASILGTWDNSRTWLERTAHILNGVPVILDDTSRRRKDEDIAAGLYAVAQGRGRGRGTIRGIAQSSYFRTVLLSTGEQPATSFTQDGGTRARVLTVRGLPFGRRDPETGQFAQQVNRQLCEHYGHAGLRFMTWLMQERPRWSEWAGVYQQWVSYYAQKPPTAESGRIAQYAALITVAGTMAHHALELPWEYANPLAAIWTDIVSEAADAAGEERALRDVLSWAYSHEKTFHGRAGADMFGHDKTGPVVMSGRWDAGAWEFIAFYPTVVRQVLQEQGYHPESILTGWRDRGWLGCTPSKYTERVRITNGEQVRMVKILRGAFEAVGEGEAT